MKIFCEKVLKGGLRPPNPRKPTACGHPYAYPQDGRRYKALGGYAAEMGIRGLNRNKVLFLHQCNLYTAN